MRQNRNKRQRKNIFDSDSDHDVDKQNQTQEQEAVSNCVVKQKSMKMLQRLNQKYDPNRYEENKHYIGNNDENKQKGHKSEKIIKRRIRTIKLNRKSLFQNRQQNNDEQKNQQAKQQKQDLPSQGQQKQNHQQINVFELQKEQQDIENDKKDDIKSKLDICIYRNSELTVEQKETQNKQDLSHNEQRIQNTQGLTSQSNMDKQQSDQYLDFSCLIKNAKSQEQIKKLIYEPIPKDYRLFGQVKKINNPFSQSFQLILEDCNEPFLFSQNKRGSIGANYYISLNQNIKKDSSSYLGKLRGNSLGSGYHIYNAGKQPQKNINRKQWRISMGKIRYEPNFMGLNGPRRLQVFIPNAQSLEEYDAFKLSQKQQIQFYKSSSTKKYRNKQAQWIQSLKSYGLNFGERVKQASIKNFILVSDQVFEQQQFFAPDVLSFGKINQNIFSLEASYPLSIFQAFCISLSQFDFKFSCQ